MKGSGTFRCPVPSARARGAIPKLNPGAQPANDKLNHASPVPPESTHCRKGSAVMNRRLCRIVVSSMSAAMLFGFAGVEAGAAQASAQVPASSTVLVLPQTDPPGPCTPDEVGQSKVGPDGNTYTCLPIGSEPGGIDDTSGETGSSVAAADTISDPKSFDPNTLKGQTPQQVRDRIPADWPQSGSNTGGGEVFRDPNNPGRQIRIMPGYPKGSRSDPLTTGPYAVVSQNGVTEKIPLAGNPTF